MKFPARTIGFRLDPDQLSLLAQRAQCASLSPAQLARQYVLDRLQASADQELHRVRERQLAVERELAGLRRDLAAAIQVLLVAQGASHDAARAWVTQHLAGP